MGLRKSLLFARVLPVAVTLAALMAAMARAGVAAEGGAFVVVVNAANRLESLTAAQLAALFLKKTTRWPDDSEATPFDLAGNSAVRLAFSRQVLGKEMAQVRSYWQQQIFSGRGVPPTEFPTEADVLAAVAAHPGGVAYVAAGARLGTGVRALRIAK